MKYNKLIEVLESFSKTDLISLLRDIMDDSNEYVIEWIQGLDRKYLKSRIEYYNNEGDSND